MLIGGEIRDKRCILSVSYQVINRVSSTIYNLQFCTVQHHHPKYPTRPLALSSPLQVVVAACALSSHPTPPDSSAPVNPCTHSPGSGTAALASDCRRCSVRISQTPDEDWMLGLFQRTTRRMPSAWQIRLTQATTEGCHW